MSKVKKSKQYLLVERYIKEHAVPKRIGRVIYNDQHYSSATKQIVQLIERHGLTAISLTNYRRLQK